jgi:hypothetical protein
VSRLTQLVGNEAIPCSRCAQPATVLLFDGERMATASLLMFFCKSDLSKYLRDHPKKFEELANEMGVPELCLLLD